MLVSRLEGFLSDHEELKYGKAHHEGHRDHEESTIFLWGVAVRLVWDSQFPGSTSA